MAIKKLVISIIAVLVMLVNVTSARAEYAYPKNNNYSTRIIDENMQIIDINGTKEAKINQKSSNHRQVWIFIAGIMIGYIVDGVIIYVSGYSAADLTAQCINTVMSIFRKNPNIKSISLKSGFSHTSG